MNRRMMILLVLVSMVIAVDKTSAQTIILDDAFDSERIDDFAWTVVSADRVISNGGSLRLLSSAEHTDDVFGLMSNPKSFPLFERPRDDTEYDVYFLGVRIPDYPQRLALGLYSMTGDDPSVRLPRDIHDAERFGYGFTIGANQEAPNAHWVSSAKVNAAGAASDGHGYEGFLVWDYGKVYDFRMQVTKDDINWWGRIQPEQDWRLICDPDMTLIGHDGEEPEGRSRFGVFVSAQGASQPTETPAGESDVSVERIVVTKYEPVVVETMLDERFDSDVLNRSAMSSILPESEDCIETRKGQPLRIVNSGKGSGWEQTAGIMTRPTKFPLFERPKDKSTRIYVDFLGVSMPSKAQRAALGLYSVRPDSLSEPIFPNGYGPDGGLAYYFWIIPDNDRLVENSNQLRAGIIEAKYAATDNWHHAWIWPYTEKRDLRLEVTADDVHWYLRKDAESAWRVLRDSTEYFYRRPMVPEDRGVGYWRPLYDPGTRARIRLDGSEPHGRNAFGVFVQVSAAGEDGQISWEDGDLSIEAIRVTAVKHRDKSSSE